MQEPVYVLHLITSHRRIMPRLAELLLGVVLFFLNVLFLWLLLFSMEVARGLLPDP